MLQRGYRWRAAGVVAALLLLGGCSPASGPDVATDVTDEAPSPGSVGPGKSDTPATGDDLGDGRCSGRVSGARHDGDVVVPSGARCRLAGVVVRGSLDVREAAVLVATGTRLSEDLSAERHRAVSLRGTRVGGDVELESGGEAVLRGVRVEGDLECEDNRPPPDISGTRVEGDREGQCSGP